MLASLTAPSYVVAMELALSADGDPLSQFLADCAGRNIDLSDAKGGVHPLQAIPARWRTVAKSLNPFVTELARTEADFQPDGALAIEAWRRLIYDATELFDAYCGLLPSRIKNRDAVKEYKSKVKKYRDYCAKLCNRMKHEGAEIAFLWASSPSNGRRGSRYLIRVYRDGNALVRDDAIHEGRMAGRGLVRDAHELAHRLLRVDLAAALLIRGLHDGQADPLMTVPPELHIGASLKTLAELRATRHADEPGLHYGIAFEAGRLLLRKVTADDFGPSANIRTSLTVESPTTSYSVA